MNLDYIKLNADPQDRQKYLNQYWTYKFRNFISKAPRTRELDIGRIYRNLSITGIDLEFDGSSLLVTYPNLRIRLDQYFLFFSDTLKWSIKGIREIDLIFIFLVLQKDDSRIFHDVRYLKFILNPDSWTPVVGSFIKTISRESSVKAKIFDESQCFYIKALMRHGFLPSISYWGKGKTGRKGWRITKYRGKHGSGFKMITATPWTLKHVTYFVFFSSMQSVVKKK